MTDRPTDPAPALSIRLGTIVWVALGAVFLALRVGPILNLPVGGAEAVHLSGAWQASTGAADARFIPTLFQALSAFLLNFSDSEQPSRWLAFAATATVPLAFWLLRRPLGEPGALIALFLVTFDAPAIVLGTHASAMGWDVAITVWLAVIALRNVNLRLGWAALGFLLATSGPLWLPLGAILAARLGTRGRRADLRWAAAGVAGAVIGILLASFRFGLGWEGLRVPPFDLFAASFDERWSSASGFGLSLLYVWPAILIGAAAAAWNVWRWYGKRPAGNPIVMAWIAAAALWWLAGLTGHGGLTAPALTLPLALCAGPALARLASDARRADWQTAAIALPLAALFTGMAMALVLDWAEFGRVGSANQQARVAIFSAAAALLVGFVATVPLARRALAVVPALALAILASGGINIGFVAEDDLLPSPFVPEQARALRDFALEQTQLKGGDIVIHPQCEAELTWPLRDSGVVVVSSRVPASARVLLWPAASGRPEGFDVVEGNWALTRERRAPTADALAYLHWLFDRNTLRTVPSDLAVYVRGAQ
ncbi:MAG: hypothetical protein ACKVVT_07690 [Dehalococcoidia bacterium]